MASANITIAGFGTSKAAWIGPARSSFKTDLKDIMNQASASRTSNLTQAMTVRDSEPPKAGKMSQKERKKSQQQHIKSQENVLTDKDVSPASTPSTSSQSKSPWQSVQPTQRPGLKEALSSPLQSESARASLLLPSVRPSARTVMTMRQTVAGTPPATSKPEFKPARSVSSPSSTPSSKPLPPQIQSIRHTPSPGTSSLMIDAGSSMADILAQQQFEKAAIKEAVAKRSLQEIQQEQEFQQWWDSESRRVQEGESQPGSSGPRRGKGGRGRGGNRRGSGRGDLAVEANDKTRRKSAVEQGSDGMPAGSGKGGSRGRGRGRGREATR